MGNLDSIRLSAKYHGRVIWGLAGGVDINTKGKDGMSFLLWAYPAGEKMFERILHHGADPNYVCESNYDTPGHLKKGRTILERAILSYHDQKFENYIDLLLLYGVDPDFGEIPPIFTALHRSKDFEMSPGFYYSFSSLAAVRKPDEIAN